jgi:hypothetical protein
MVGRIFRPERPHREVLTRAFGKHWNDLAVDFVWSGCSRPLDKRVCFDFFRPLSTTGDLLIAYQERRSGHSAKTFWDSRAFEVKNTGQSVGHALINAPTSLTYALAQAMEGVRDARSETHVDAHAWVFTPASYELIMLELARLGLTDWQIERKGEAQFNNVPAEEPIAFFRPVNLGDGKREDARFRVARLPGQTIPGVRTYFCHHLMKHLVWCHEWRSHPNGAVNIKRAIMVSPDPERVGTVFQKMFRDRVQSRSSCRTAGLRSSCRMELSSSSVKLHPIRPDGKIIWRD